MVNPQDTEYLTEALLLIVSSATQSARECTGGRVAHEHDMSIFMREYRLDLERRKTGPHLHHHVNKAVPSRSPPGHAV
jgi:hypothetical protein